MAVRLLVCLRLVNLTATKLKAFQERFLGTFMPFEGDLRGHSGFLLPDDRMEKLSAYLPVAVDRDGAAAPTCRLRPLPNSPAQAPALLSQSDRQVDPSQLLDRIEPAC